MGIDAFKKEDLMLRAETGDHQSIYINELLQRLADEAREIAEHYNELHYEGDVAKSNDKYERWGRRKLTRIKKKERAFFHKYKIAQKYISWVYGKEEVEVENT